MNDYQLKIEKNVDAPRNVVFDTWTSTDALKQWHCGTILESVMELEPGGTFLIRFEPEEHCDNTCVQGKYLEVNRPERLIYTWSWNSVDSTETNITINFIEQTAETTLIQVVHEKFQSEKIKDDHIMGWEACLDGLKQFLIDNRASL